MRKIPYVLPPAYFLRWMHPEDPYYAYHYEVVYAPMINGITPLVVGEVHTNSEKDLRLTVETMIEAHRGVL